GTGYSSLSYLQNFNLHALKIDKSFVNGLPDNRDSIEICKAIIALSHSLDLRVVAEGIETAAQYQLLKRLGADESQGYYTGRPMLPEAITEMLRTAMFSGSPEIG
ncbi:MAG: EAL domain-containing protein, partial [Chromatiales bacterium]|nr:EAL domain-containing protein [Chromatiales bacterium]